jgi:hypothetical protein
MTESTTALKPVTFLRDVSAPFRAHTQNKLWQTEDGLLVGTSYLPREGDEPGETMVFPALEDGSPDFDTIFQHGPFGEFFAADRWVLGDYPQHTEALATLGYVPAEEDNAHE